MRLTIFESVTRAYLHVDGCIMHTSRAQNWYFYFLVKTIRFINQEGCSIFYQELSCNHHPNVYESQANCKLPSILLVAGANFETCTRSLVCLVAQSVDWVICQLPFIRAVVRYRSYGNTYTFGSKFHTCVDERIGMYFGVNQKNLFWYLKKNHLLLCC